MKPQSDQSASVHVIPAGLHRFEIYFTADDPHIAGGPVAIRWDEALMRLTRDQALELAQILDEWLGR